MTLRLRVIEGPDRGRTFSLEPDEPLFLGRGQGAGLRDPCVSRVHCELRLEGGTAVLVDAGSSTGTFVNGERITRQEVRPGDRVRLGETELKVESAGTSGAETADRLSQIQTLWSVVIHAHGGDQAPERAREALLHRYRRAAHRYLLGAVRDPDLADDLSQEFALRFVRGDFQKANPQRGRFRDYLKVALVHLVTDHHRARQQGPRELSPDAPEPAAPGEESGVDFLAGWRQEILDQTWEALKRTNPSYNAVLRLRTENPDLASAEMASLLAVSLGKPVTAAWVRKTQQRAQEKFADLLLEEVAQSLELADENSLRQELRDLDLLRYCAEALQRRAERI